MGHEVDTVNKSVSPLGLRDHIQDLRGGVVTRQQPVEPSRCLLLVSVVCLGTVNVSFEAVGCEAEGESVSVEAVVL